MFTFRDAWSRVLSVFSAKQTNLTRRDIESVDEAAGGRERGGAACSAADPEGSHPTTDACAGAAACASPAPFGAASGPSPAEDFTMPPPADAPPSWWRTDAPDESTTPAVGGALDRDLYDRLVHMLRDPDQELPRLPAVAQQALLMLNDRNVNYQRLARVIEQDPAVSAEVLRLANSVAYRGIKEVTRLDLAFGRLGHRTLQSMILTTTTRGLAIAAGGANRSLGEELWKRSLASGVILGRMAKRHRLDEGEAFLVGLLHDIGMLALLRAVHEYQKTHGRAVSRAMFDCLAREWHEHLGLRVADAWNLPQSLVEIIGSHHSPPADDDPLRTHRLLVQFSDCACAMLGYSPAVPMDWRCTPCVRALGLLEDVDARRELEDLPQMIEERIQAFSSAGAKPVARTSSTRMSHSAA